MSEVGRLDQPVDPMLCCERCWEPIVATAVHWQGLATVVTWQHKESKSKTLVDRHPVVLTGWRDRAAVDLVLRTLRSQEKARRAAREAARKSLAYALGEKRGSR